MTVYVIDDEPALVELLSQAVNLFGFEAQGYTLASRFFEQTQVVEPNSILLLDLQMPEMDGIEVMRRMASMAHTPALILISGQDSGVLHAAEKLARAHQLEIVGSLPKPVSLEQLQQLLKAFVITDKPIDLAAPEFEVTAAELRDAIENDQLTLHYQPKLDIGSGAVCGVEALARWQHPTQGLIYPNRFIAVAEKNGLIGEFTHQVIEKAVVQEQQWQDAGLQLPVAVNVSAENITSLTLPEHLAELLADKRLNPNMLVLEVTESALMGELVTSLDILTRLRLKGIRLSIDDFGTGYSSLSQLHRVPFTELKIDQSFVANMVEDTEARAIVKTCILLGHELNMQVVAEGVESQAQLNLLRQLNCDSAQGYFFSNPVSSETITQTIQNQANGGLGELVST
jgi:EAL domain-containing protein (putative c-di-GMP-specific phosphodiesterase class I)/FixJ family two-component response regulator